MKIASPRFGEIEVEEDKLITFPQGLPGFETCQRFVLVHPDSEQPKLFYLQCADQAEVAFSISSPDQFGLHYQFTLTDAETALIGLTQPTDAVVMVILRRDETPGGESGPVRAVLTAPLIINLATRRAIQKVIAQLGCDITLHPVQ